MWLIKQGVFLRHEKMKRGVFIRGNSQVQEENSAEPPLCRKWTVLVKVITALDQMSRIINV